MQTMVNSKILKPHHHVRVTEEHRLDLQVWKRFLCQLDNIFQPFMDSVSINAEEIDMYSDASGNYGLGFGAYCGPEWSWGQWDEDFCRSFQPSIEYLELFAVLVGVLNWIRLLANRRVVLFCDNEAVVHMINKNTSSCRQCMVLMRLLVEESISRNVRVYTKHVGTKENGKADALSRLDYKRFKQLAGDTMNQQQTAIPKEIWPMNKIWRI